VSMELRTPGIKFSFDTSSLQREVKELIDRILPPEKIVQVAIAGGNVIADAWRMLEAPHTVTGEYQETIQVHIVDKDERSVEIMVGTTAPQARYLEYGTSKETAQPVMRPAYDMAMGPAEAAMQEAILQAARGQ
jgi:HK97 gp10 family phage protein